VLDRLVSEKEQALMDTFAGEKAALQKKFQDEMQERLQEAAAAHQGGDSQAIEQQIRSRMESEILERLRNRNSSLKNA